MPIDEFNYHQVCALVDQQIRGEFIRGKLIPSKEATGDDENSEEIEQNVGEASVFRTVFDQPELVELLGRLFRINSLGTRLEIDLNEYYKLDNVGSQFGFVKDAIVLFGAFVFDESLRSREEREEKKCEHISFFVAFFYSSSEKFTKQNISKLNHLINN